MLNDGQNATTTTRLRFQEQRSRGYTTQTGQQRVQPQPQPQQQQQQQSKEPTLAGRRKSLVRPTELRIPSKSILSTTGNAPEPLSPSRLSPRKSQPDSGKAVPISPKKVDMPPPSSPRTGGGAPISPKRTDMPPPPLPRHGRSISLKQPPVSSIPGGTSASDLGHLRRHSQVVKGQNANKTAGQVQPSTAQRARPQLTSSQHISSPKKVAKPPTPTSDRHPHSESNLSSIPSSWPGVAALQTEVLQLNLLHSSYVQGDVEWRANAEASLRKQYDSVAKSYRSVLAEEKEAQRCLNLQALNLWHANSRDNRNRQGFPEQIQTLSSIVQDISDLCDTAGRYTRVVRVFEDWLQKVDRIRRRRDLEDDTDEAGGSIDSLGYSWKKELFALTAKLELCARKLQDLSILTYGEIESDAGRRREYDSSALIRLVTSFGEMTSLMVEEAHAMRTIEEGIARSEREWISRRAKQLATSSQKLSHDNVGIWKTLLG